MKEKPTTILKIPVHNSLSRGIENNVNDISIYSINATTKLKIYDLNENEESKTPIHPPEMHLTKKS